MARATSRERHYTLKSRKQAAISARKVRPAPEKPLTCSTCSVEPRLLHVENATCIESKFDRTKEKGQRQEGCRRSRMRTSPPHCHLAGRASGGWWCRH